MLDDVEPRTEWRERAILCIVDRRVDERHRVGERRPRVLVDRAPRELFDAVFRERAVLVVVEFFPAYAYEYGGSTIDRMTMDERMTICNMSIEGGARIGYINPDETTFEFLRGRPFAPRAEEFERATTWWRTLASDANARYDDRVKIDADSTGIGTARSSASINVQRPTPESSTYASRSATSGFSASARAASCSSHDRTTLP